MAHTWGQRMLPNKTILLQLIDMIPVSMLYLIAGLVLAPVLLRPPDVLLGSKALHALNDVVQREDRKMGSPYSFLSSPMALGMGLVSSPSGEGSFSMRSRATTMPTTMPPSLRILSMASLLAVPAVTTSSTMSTLFPASGAPTMLPPSPWSLASLRSNESRTRRTSRPRRRGSGGQGGQRDALVGGAEDHVELKSRGLGSLDDGLGVGEGDGLEEVGAVEGAGVEEVGGETLGLELEGAELEGASADGGLEEVGLVLGEGGSHCGRWRWRYSGLEVGLVIKTDGTST